MAYEIELSGEAEKYLKSIPETARRKLLYYFNKVENGEIRKDYFKKLSGRDNCYEFIHFPHRLMAFVFREEGARQTTIFITHGFEKKKQDTPKKELKKLEAYKNKIL